ncbi:uncharacterized protein [Aristolochia californica]|uniref:uncharacterized protein n=1 Tax=Aristolochia californica TaxID=171875 RepID=UPI0035DFED26
MGYKIRWDVGWSCKNYKYDQAKGSETHRSHHFLILDASVQRKMTNPCAMAENPYHVRSISLPTRSHPLAATIEEDLEKLRCSEAFSQTTSAEAICSGLCSLGEVYDLVAELLVLPQTQRVLAQTQNWVEELLDGSVKLVDMCDATRNVLLQVKEDVKDLHSALRRRKGELSMESKLRAYWSSRKKLRKEIRKHLEILKKMDGKTACSPLSDQEKHLQMVVRFLREVKSMTVSIFHSILSFISSSPKTSKWSLISKLRLVNKVEQNGDEVGRVDLALSSLQSHITEMKSVKHAQKQMEALEVRLDSLEGGVERVFRRLIQTRVSLLNILTQ